MKMLNKGPRVEPFGTHSNMEKGEEIFAKACMMED
jgi:hypothetical protein